jgi:hypothetical protein
VSARKCMTHNWLAISCSDLSVVVIPKVTDAQPQRRACARNAHISA